MNKIYKLTILILTVVLLFGCSFNDENQSVKIEKNSSGYNFEATYPERKTKDVVAYLDKNLKQDNPYKSENEQIDADVVLPNDAAFYLKTRPGLIVINFKKQKNNEANYQRLEKLCLGIKEELKN